MPFLYLTWVPFLQINNTGILVTFCETAVVSIDYDVVKYDSL